LNEPDPDLRMTPLVAAYVTNMRKFCMPRQVAENPKLASQHLCELVKLNGLQKIETADRERQYKELRKDFKGFVKRVRERAVAYEQYKGLKNTVGNKGSASGNGSQSNSGGSNGDGGGA
jgi:uncharacterized membrane protein YgcG